MRKVYSLISMFIMVFAMCQNASAQGKITYGDSEYEVVATEKLSVDATAAKDYEGLTADFSTQLENMLKAVGLEAISNEKFIQVDNAGVGFEYNANDGWHAADGAIEGKTWGTEEKLVCVKPWNDEGAVDGTISYIGCIDTKWAAGESHVCKFAAINDGKAAVLEVTLNFVGLGVEDPTEVYSALNVVKEYEMTLEYTQGNSYEGRTDSLAVDGIYEALGIDAATMAKVGDAIFVTRTVATDDAGSTVWTDSLTVSRFGTDGWFGRYTSFDEATGEETAIAQNAPHGWGGGCTIFLQNAKIEDGIFSVKNGQYDGTLKVGDTDYIELFVCNGTKAAKITIKIVVNEPEEDPDKPADVPFSEMTKAGEQNLVAAGRPGDYATVEVKFDLKAVLEALGCESASDITPWIYQDESSLITPTTTDYWQSESGISQKWSSDACAKVYPSNFDIESGKFTVMQMAGVYSEITEAVGPFPIKYIFAYGDKYYQINIAYTVDPNIKTDPMKVVAEDYLSMQMTPINEYLYGTTTQLDYEYFEQVLGTSDFVLYGEKYSDAKGVFLDKTTNCTDGDAKGKGFWYKTTVHENGDGEQVVTGDGWGSNSFGFQLSTSGVISWFQTPGDRTVGENFLANIYFVNEETNEAIKIKLDVKIVETVTPEATTVGTEEVVEEAKDATAEGTYIVTIDLSEGLKAIGLTAETASSANIVAPKGQFSFSSFEPEEDITYNAAGYYTTDEDKTVSMGNLSIDGATGTFTVDPMDIDFAKEDAAGVTAHVGIEYDGKRYVYSVNLGNAAFTSISGVQAVGQEAIYTASGIKVSSLVKGLNIIKKADGRTVKVLK